MLYNKISFIVNEGLGCWLLSKGFIFVAWHTVFWWGGPGNILWFRVKMNKRGLLLTWITWYRIMIIIEITIMIIIWLAWVTQWGSQQNMNTVTTVNTSFVTWKSKCKHVCSDLSPVIWLGCFLERLYSCLGWAAGLMRMKMEWTEENGCLLHSCILTMHPLRFPTSFLDFQKPAATWHLVSSTSLFDSWNLESVW